MHTHQAVAAYIIERLTVPQEKKIELTCDLRKMRCELQLGILEGGRFGMNEAAAKWANFELHKVFMNTLAKRMERAVVEGATKQTRRSQSR